MVTTSSAVLGHYAVGQHEIAYLLHNAELLERRPALVPLVFIHGLTMSVRFWELAMLPEIDESLPWLSVSLPLHYPSTFEGDPREADLSGPAFAKTLHAVLTGVLGERDVRVVGHSVGALAALAYAAHYPKHCLGVLCIGGFASGKESGLEDALATIYRRRDFTEVGFALAWGAMQRSLWITRQVVRTYANDTEALDNYAPFEPTLALVHPDLAQHDTAAMFHFIVSLYVVDAVPNPAAIICPVWMIAGREDPVVGYACQAKLAAQLPPGQLHALEGCGHLAFAEREEEFRALLLAFSGV